MKWTPSNPREELSYTGTHLSDSIHLGAITKTFPLAKIHDILQETGRQSCRIRKLPAHVMVYYVIALCLHMHLAYGEVLRCLWEGLSAIGLPTQKYRTTTPTAISRARRRLGIEPLKRLYEEIVQPIATPETQGAFYKQWKLTSIDGTTFDTADTPENVETWGYPGASRGRSAFPKIRLVTLLESGPHVMFAAQFGPYSISEKQLAKKAFQQLRPEMLCLADRGFCSYELWNHARETGADLLWRARKDLRLPVLRCLPDGSYLSRIYGPKDRENVRVRVVEYRLEGAKDPEKIYRVITSILDENAAPAQDLAALYHERWEIETTFDELKTHLRGSKIVLRSKSPELVRQEVYGLLLAHFAVRALMHEAALQGERDPDDISFVHTLRVIRRKIISIPPSADVTRPPADPRRDLGAASQLQSRTSRTQSRQAQDEQVADQVSTKIRPRGPTTTTPDRPQWGMHTT